MDLQRRALLKDGAGLTVLGLALSSGLLTPSEVFASEDWNAKAFDAKTIADAVKALGGSVPVESKDLLLNVPDIAENGAVVPVSVTSNIPKTQDIAILVEKNPSTLCAVFSIPEGTDTSVNTRVKMAQSSDVYALVKADGKFYFAKKEVKVTLGGCGG